ncbi:MAG: FHA domain-containing protein [Synechococcus sp.]|nr:FHA domain-containing protein [Synechococcus sp.]
MSHASARLVLSSDRRKSVELDAKQPLTIGRASSNRLCLASHAEVSDHHAVVRLSPTKGWLVCNWQSRDGTFLEGRQVRQCQRLEHGDEIRLGLQGPRLVFELSEAPSAAVRRQIDVNGETVEVAAILSAAVQSLPHHPHIFSWWLLLCLGGLLLLPFPLLFWPLQLGALAGWIVLGSRQQHQLLLVLRDGRAIRHGFANRRTALAHRNGIRQAMGGGSTL